LTDDNNGYGSKYRSFAEMLVMIENCIVHIIVMSETPYYTPYLHHTDFPNRCLEILENELKALK